MQYQKKNEDDTFTHNSQGYMVVNVVSKEKTKHRAVNIVYFLLCNREEEITHTDVKYQTNRGKIIDYL